MKPLKPLLRLLRRLSPEWLFLALLAVLLTAVALFVTNNSWWAVLPLSVVVGMVLAVMWNDKPETPRQEPNDQAGIDQIRDRTIDPIKQTR